MIVKYLKTHTAKAYSSTTKRRVKLELLWGDRCEVVDATPQNGLLMVNARWAHKVWVAEKDLGDEPLLELYFIDVGQGDGVLLVTPERKHILIDGGYTRKKQPHGKSAADFIDWKFKVDYGQRDIVLDAMISSHCDADHYGGMWDLLRDRSDGELDTDRTIVNHFYHAGVSWWRSDDNRRFLGRKQDGYLVELLEGRDAVAAGLEADADLRLQGEWAQFLKRIHEADIPISRLGCDPTKPIGFLPGFEADQETTIRVLGPIVTDVDGAPAVKDFTSNSQNTNGNSTLLRVDYGRARILLTGDLNKRSQQYILEALAGKRLELEADVTKCCHHGSDDCSYEFMQRVRAAATVISSGDDETHAHPRPNVVAASGSSGYLNIEDDELVTPLVYSTEISRSLRIGDPYAVRYNNYPTPQGPLDVEMENESRTEVAYTRTSSGAIRPSKKKRTLDRLKVVDGVVYGLVNVRTDGNTILCATLNEGKSKWEVKTFDSRF